MERDVRIYFKVDGIEEYITSLDQLQDVLQGVEGATDDATKATKELQEAGEDFDKLEQRLETTEGAVKVLAGSFEVLAGAAGLLGLEENEFFKELEENVINVIALAEGAVNMAEGVKLLAQNQKIATAAQRAFNLVAKANPYVLLATSIIALVGAIAAYVSFTNEEAIPTEEELAAMRERNAKEYEKAKEKEEMAKKAEEQRIKTLEDLKKALYDVSEAESKKNDTTLDGVIATNEALQAELERELDITNQLIYATELRVNKSEEELQSLLDQGLNLTEEEQKLYDLYQRRGEQTETLTELNNTLNEAYKERNRLIYDQNLIEVDQVDRMDRMTTGLERFNKELDKTIEKRTILRGQPPTFQPLQEDVDSFGVAYYKAFNQFAEEPEVWKNMLIRDTTAAFNFMSDISTIFTKDAEKRAERQFKLNKALSLSNAVINTAAGITDALAKDGTFPGSRFISAAAVAASGAAQIATILRQQYEGAAQSVDEQGLSQGLNPASAINYNFGQQAGEEIQPGQLSSGQSLQPEPMKAYVLVSDVNNAQQANNQIENLARL